MYYLLVDNIVDNYTELLKKRYNSTKYTSESRWPPFTPAKFTKLGYIIHKHKRTSKDAKKSAVLARSGNPLSENVAIEEEVSNIFIPIESNEHPQIILIEGAPGIGKTMLMKEIGRLWATEKILKDKKVLYFLSLRDPKINKMNSTEDMFFYSCKNREHARICDTYFGNNGGQGLAILLDGLDENPQTMQSQSFLYKILIEEKIFIDACIVVTSRPHATIDLLKHVSYRVEIIGFTDKRRQEFVEENLKENTEDLKSYLQKHEIIDTLCYVPLNMTIVLFLFNEKVGTESTDDLPKTQTELTEKAVRMTVFHNLQKLGITESKNDLGNLPSPYNNIFYYLSELAYNALGQRKLTFTIDEIKTACWIPCRVPIGDDEIERAVINGFGLIQTAEFFADADGDIESVSNFAHYSVQELVAAWYIAFKHRSFFQRFPFAYGIQKGSQKSLQVWFQRNVLAANFWKGDFINMWSFYIGLTKGEDFAFKHFLSGNTFFSYMQCKNFSWLKRIFNSDHEIVEHIEPCPISTNILKSKIKTLLLYFLLQEAPGNEMVKYLDTVVTDKKLDVSEQPLNSKQDLYLLSYILSRPYLTKQWELVNLSHCEIDDEIFEDLYNVLTRNDGRPKPDIKNLSLSGNKLKSCSNAIAHLVCCQKVLHLNLSNNMLEDLNPFERCGDFLETLHVSNNKLGNEQVSRSLTALKFLRKLKILTLNHNDIEDDEDVNDAIGLALCSCNSLENLELDGNIREFENKAMLLFTVINEVRNSKSDEHCYNGQQDKASAFLKILDHCDQMDYQPDSCALRNKLIQSKKLDISYNGLETGAGRCLGQRLHLLHNLKRLDITKNKISDEAIESLTKGIFLTPNLKEFKYEENWFSKKSCMIFEMIHKLRTAIHKSFKCEPSEIQALLFILNCINDNVEELQSSDIISTLSLVSELSLSYNEPTTLDYKLTSEDLQELCAVLTWFKQLEVLDVRNNDITDEAKESLTKVMLQISGLNCVKLVGNPIFDDQLSMAIFDTIKNVREKQAQSIIDNQKCSSHIQAYSVIYVLDCLSDLKNSNCFKSFDNIITLDIDLQSDYAGKFFEYLNFLPFLKNLKINNVTCITNYGINQLSGYLSQNVMLTTLDLSHCNLENLKTKNEAGINNSLKLLKCNYCKITNELLRNFMLMFRNVDHLEIEGNYLDDKGISTLHNVLLSHEHSGQQKLNQLVNLKTLNIANNNVSDKSLRILTTEILLAAELEEFKYNENLFSENSIMIFEMIHKLRTAVHKSFKCEPSEIEALLFILNYINENVEELQSSDIVSTISDIKELNLSYSESTTLDYKLTSKDLKELCAVLTWFKQLEVLDVRNNDITDEAAKKPMVKAVLQMNTLNELKLIGNPIFDNMSVFDTITKLREGQVHSISCNPNSSFHEEGYCVIYIMDCLNSLKIMNHLDMFDNITTLDIDSESELAGKIFECLNYLPFLRKITINHVSCITEYGMNQFSEYLSHESSLTTLDLSFCNLENFTIKKVVGVNDSLKTLKCNCSKITDELLRNFMLMFRSVNHLEVEGNYLGDKGISTLHSVLLNQILSTSMTTLKLANNQITSRSAAKIIEIVQKHKVKHLDVSHNRLTTFQCPKNHTVTTLEELHISGNGLEIDEGFTHILQNCIQLVILDLENNNITNDTFKHLATGYLFTSTLALKNLCLNKNPCIEKPGPMNIILLQMIEKFQRGNYQYFKCCDNPNKFEVFLSVLELVDNVCSKSDDVPKIISRIESLDMSYSEPSNSKLKSCDIINFCKYLKYFESLQCIDMSGNNIDSAVKKDLAIAVLKNHRITEIQLKDNPIYELKDLFDTIQQVRTHGTLHAFKGHPKRLQHLVTILKYVDTFDGKTCDITKDFEHLDISWFYSPRHNIDKPEEINALIQHLKLLKLKSLNLSNAHLTSHTLDILSEFLRNNNTLQRLDISNNNIQAEGALIIVKSLDHTNTTLTKLNLNNNRISGRKCTDIATIIRNLSKDVEVDMTGNKLTEESKKILKIR